LIFFVQVFELDELKVAISEHLERKHKELALSIDLHEIFVVLNGFSKLQRLGNINYITLLVSNERHVPFFLQAPIPNLKPLISHLKYVFLGDRGTLPIIISNGLSALQ
jgi:hypothetical protein